LDIADTRDKLREYGRVGLLAGAQVSGAAGLLARTEDSEPSE